MGIRLAVNAAPLRSPLTGVGQYIRHLMEAIEARGDAEIRYFYGTHWGRHLIASPLSAMDLAKRLVKRTVPRPYLVMSAAQRPVFAARMLAFRPQVYHEPNYVSFPFRDQTVVTVHDLSFVHFPELQPRNRVEHLERYLAATVAEAAHVITDSEEVRREAIAHCSLEAERVTARLTFRRSRKADTQRRGSGMASLSRFCAARRASRHLRGREALCLPITL